MERLAPPWVGDMGHRMALVEQDRRSTQGAVGWVGVVTLVAAQLWGCTCSSSEPAATSVTNARDAGARGSGATRTIASPRCTPGSAQQTLHALGARTQPAVDEEYAPFAVEVGAALTDANGFWVPWLSSDGKSSQVGITILGSDLLTARTVELGDVRWDGGPPRLARMNNESVLAAVPDSDANGGSYRIAGVGPTTVTWGAELDGSSDDSPAFDFASSGGQALLVWDDYSREQGRGTIRGSLLGERGELVRDVGYLSPLDSDVESPRLAQRADGYWLSWLRVKWQQSKTLTTGNQTPDGLEAEQPVLTPKARWIEVVPVDKHGGLIGAAIRVSPPDAMVQGYDLQSGHEGALLVTWRQDFSNAGTSGGQVWSARLRPDGSLEQHLVQSSELAGTAPVFLFDPKAPSGIPHGWLTLEAERGDTALAALSPFGKPLESLAPSSGIGSASILAALDGQLLVAQPKGRDMALKLLRCKYEPATINPDAGAR
jgi:hypothetical protein